MMLLLIILILLLLGGSGLVAFAIKSALIAILLAILAVALLAYPLFGAARRT